MKTIISLSTKLTKGISRYVNSQNIVEFLGEVLQEVAIQGLEHPEELFLLLLIIPVVASVFVAKALATALWKKIRNRTQAEVDSDSQEVSRG